MLLAMVATPLSIVVVTALVAALLPHRWLWAIPIGLGAGLLVLGNDLRKALRPTILLPSDREPELWAIVDRLCVAADLPRPEISLYPDKQPNSWLMDLPRRPPRLHVTRGLLDLLEPAELEAVVAHELAHVANRDVIVMTVVGMPAEALSRGAARTGGFHGFVPAAVGGMAKLGSASLSRHRELTADAGAVALTGRPSTLASALLKVSGALAVVPKKDLRAVAGFQALNLLPVGGEPSRPWRTLRASKSASPRWSGWSAGWPPRARRPRATRLRRHGADTGS
jgi:heat shock protein HtpX